MADWLSRQNHKDDQDEEIEGMQVNINNIEISMNIPECMMICEFQHEKKSIQSFTTTERMHHEGVAKEQRQCSTELRPYWTFQDDMAVIDRYS